MSTTSCPAHPYALLIDDHRAGDQICSECGLVVGDRVIDVGSEWRTFSKEKANSDPSRVGKSENPLLNGSELSIIVSSLFTSFCKRSPVLHPEISKKRTPRNTILVTTFINKKFYSHSHSHSRP